MRTGKDFADMVERISDAALGQELKKFFQSNHDVEEVRATMQSFLEWYVRSQK